MTTPDSSPPTDAAVLAEFWALARRAHPSLPVRVPEARAFGVTPEHGDTLLGLVLEGAKTATASSAWDYEDEGEPLPATGDLSIILDGSGRPRAVLEVIAIEVVPFEQVTEGHAFAEGEGDRSLEAWRSIHERFWREHSVHGYAPEMPVVCERFRVLVARPAE